MNKKLLITLVILCSLLAIVSFISFQKRNTNVLKNDNTTNTATSTASIIPNDISEFVGLISSSTDKQNLYISKKYGIQFEYPHGWYIGDNHLGYGTFQLFNYDESAMERGELAKSGTFNKIEASIGDSDHYGISDIYTEKKRDTRTIEIAGQSTTRELITFDNGTEALSYSVPLPQLAGKFFGVTMYGNASNFSVLDELMATLRWVK